MTIALIVEFEVNPPKVAEFVERLSEKARASLGAEPGCLTCDVAQSIDHSTVFTLYEVFHDVGSVQAHLESHHFREFQRLTAHYTTRRQCRAFARILPTVGVRSLNRAGD